MYSDEKITIQKLINTLISKYKYKKLPDHLSEKVKILYDNHIPQKLKYNNEVRLYSSENGLISIGFNRIVIGDYGAYIEIDEDQLYKPNIKIKDGEEYRLDCKYNADCIYLTVNDASNIKIYKQIKLVDYADYVIGKYYVSVIDISYW